MAFYQNEEEKLAAQAQEGAPVQTGGQSGIITGQGAQPTVANNPPAAGEPRGPSSPGNFVGLQQYLDANKTQSGQLGNKVSGQIAGTITEAQNKIDKIGEGFKNVAGQGTISNLDTAQDEAARIAQQTATANQQQLAQSQGANKERFGEIANAQYTGPTQLNQTDLYDPAYQKIKDAQNYAKLSKDEAGNQQLLRDVYKEPQYSAGENRLDAYLLKGDENRTKLTNSRQNADQLESQFNAADAGAAAYAADVKAKTEQARLAAQKALEDTRTQRSSQVDQDLANIAAGWNSEQNAYANALFNSNEGKNLKLTDEMMQKLGVTPDQRIYNILKGKSLDDIKNQYVTMQAFDPNKVISKDQQAQLAALDELANTYGGALKNKYVQADIAGTLDKATAFAANKFGLTAKEAQKAFDAAAEITKRTAQATSSQGLDQRQSIIVGREITERIVKNLPWPLSDIVKWVTRTVYDTVSTDVRVGNASATTVASGTVADYLRGSRGNADQGSFSANLDWGAFMDPTGVLTGSYMSKLDDMVKQLNEKNKPGVNADWTNQILQYLQEQGYNNQIKKV